MDELLDDPVKNYLKQIGQIPLLSAEQEVELSRRIHAGAEAGTSCRPTARSTAGRSTSKRTAHASRFEEDENSRSYTEDLDDDGNEKSREDAEEKEGCGGKGRGGCGERPPDGGAPPGSCSRPAAMA